jgi:hypothetical protein
VGKTRNQEKSKLEFQSYNKPRISQAPNAKKKKTTTKNP